MNFKMNRNEVSFNSKEGHQADEREYWEKASIEEKVRMITYLRECFYGPEEGTVRANVSKFQKFWYNGYMRRERITYREALVHTNTS